MNPEKPDIKRAQYEAFKLTKEFAITRPEEIQLADIAMALGIYIREEALVGAEARLIRNGTKGVIRVNSAIPQPGRKRFAIAHELGHWKLHDSALQVCTEDDLLGRGSKAIEAEANAFSGAFLMPTPILGPLCSDEQPNLDLICELAEQFNTTLTATALRFVDACRSPCAVVFSENKKITWWKAGEGESLWLESEWEIDPGSNAWEPTSREPRRRVNPGLWFSAPEKYKNNVLFEQSMPLGRYGIVLTLLSIADPLGG